MNNNQNANHNGQPQKRLMPVKVKKSYNPAIFVGEAFKNLWRDGIMSLASILVLASCLVVLGCFALLVFNINVNMNNLASLNEIVAFTEYDVTEEDAIALGEEIKKLDNVESVEFISKTQGLEDLKETYPEFSDLFDEFEEGDAQDTEKAPETTPEVTDTEAVPDTQTPVDTSDVADDTAEAAPSDADSTPADSEPVDSEPVETAPADTQPEAPAVTDPSEEPVNKNPLAHCFRIKYKDNSKVATLEFNLDEMEGIRKVSNRQDLAMTLENLKDGISMVFVWFLVVLFVVSVFIIINTIKLAVNSHMEEIRVMKYIGAANWFIVIPYIIEGTIIGIFSGVISFLVEWGIYYKLASIISGDAPIIELISFDTIRLPVALAFVGLGVLTGVIGSCISLRKNLDA
ncbi:MAG: permease-like cell division protein FtsX [Clostridia bacterium]|nr:permease-like cell division protein FtsX [Clostridia bacterium]